LLEDEAAAVHTQAGEIAKRRAGLVEAERRRDAIDVIRARIIVGNMRAARAVKRAAVAGSRAGRSALVAAAKAAEAAVAEAWDGEMAGAGAEAEDGVGERATTSPLTRELASFLLGCSGGSGNTPVLPSASLSSTYEMTWMTTAMEPLSVRGPAAGMGEATRAEGAGAGPDHTASALCAVAAAASLRDDLRLAMTHTRAAIHSLVHGPEAVLGTHALADVRAALAARREQAKGGVLPRLAEGAAEATAGLEACRRLDAASEVGVALGGKRGVDHSTYRNAVLLTLSNLAAIRVRKP